MRHVDQRLLLAVEDVDVLRATILARRGASCVDRECSALSRVGIFEHLKLHWSDRAFTMRRSKRWRRTIGDAFMQIRKPSSINVRRRGALDEAALGRGRPHVDLHRQRRGRCRAAMAGYSTTKATMPIISSGAVSPSAWARPMMVPVRMPGMASGSTWWKIVCIFEAPTPSAASRIEGGTAPIGGAGGDDDGRQRHQRQHQAADQRGRARQAGEVDEHGQAEQAEDDRGHGGQVVDVDLDQVGPAVLRRELLQIDRGGDAERHGQQQHGHHHEERADQRDADAGRLRLARVAVGEQAGVEALRQMRRRRRACRSSRSADR